MVTSLALCAFDLIGASPQCALGYNIAQRGKLLTDHHLNVNAPSKS